MSLVDTLQDARARYAAAPSHAVPGEYPRQGTYCMVTAFNPERSPNKFRSLDALVDVLPLESLGLVYFNAAHTTEEVLALFDRAIEAAR